MEGRSGKSRRSVGKRIGNPRLLRDNEQIEIKRQKNAFQIGLASAERSFL
jgi:hypothetical protein